MTAVLLASPPLRLNVGSEAPWGFDVTVHVYVRFDSPASSAPKTERVVDDPATVLSAAEAAVATVGVWFSTVTTVCPLTPPLAAVIVTSAELPGAMKYPVMPMAPAVAFQDSIGWTAIRPPNWS